MCFIADEFNNNDNKLIAALLGRKARRVMAIPKIVNFYCFAKIVLIGQGPVVRTPFSLNGG